MAAFPSVIITEWMCAIIAGVWLRAQAIPLYKELINKNLVERRWGFDAVTRSLEELEAKTADCEIKIKVAKILMYKELSNSVVAGGLLLSGITYLIIIMGRFM